MIEDQKATLQIWRCDMPGCLAEHRTYIDSGGYGGVWPEGWKWALVDPTIPHEAAASEDHLVFCSDHAHHVDTIRLIGMVLTTSPREMIDG